MYTRSLASAVRYFLQTYWSMEGGCDVKMTDAPGRPLGCMSPWAITIWEMNQGQEGLIGFYPRTGVMVTFSAKLDGAMPTDLEDFLHAPRVGFNDVRDALAAFLHKHRWRILEWANLLVDGAPITGLVNNLIEAPRPLNMTAASRRNADWWGATVGKVVAASGNTEEARVLGYSSDITYGQALVMQTESPNEF